MDNKFDIEEISVNFFEGIFSALSFCNKALSELNLIENIIHTDEESAILSNYTFDFYKLSIRYCFNNEYCKIFTRGNVDIPSNLSSIINVNNYLYKKLGSGFESTFTNNNNLLSTILESSFYKNQVWLKEQNEVSCMSNQLNYKDVQIGFQHLSTVAQVITDCVSLFDLEYNISIPNINTSTIDFVMDHSVFRKFYFENHLKSLD
ncbi:MAG: hypothetical protein JWN56_2101 [Sphingobacteriales bacterium]|nr:hypothetical protein [Sphingobacteriales bacterium]